MAAKRKGMSMARLGRLRPGTLPANHIAFDPEIAEADRLLAMDETEADLRAEAAERERGVLRTGEGEGGVATKDESPADGEAPESPQEASEPQGDAEVAETPTDAVAGEERSDATDSGETPPKRRRRKPKDA